MELGIMAKYGVALALMSVLLASAMPPPNPIECSASGCTLSNSYGVWPDRKPCAVSTAVFPTTEAELRSVVADANRRRVKVKVASKFSHTIPKLACPNGTETILISTEKYDSTITVDKASQTVTASAGVGLRALIDKVEEQGLSLVAAPYWEGVSVGGVISTGAHGCSWWGRGGSLHDHVVGIKMVVGGNRSEGYAKVVELKADDPLLHAAKVSLGLLGVICEVRFRLEPEFKRSVTFNFTADDGMEDEFMNHAKSYEFGDIQWYPSRYTAVYRYDNRLPLNVSGNGANDFIGFQSNLVPISQSLRLAERAAESARNVKTKCALASTAMAYKKLIGNGLKNKVGGLFTGYPVIGRQGNIQTSGSCLYSSPTNIAVSCAWDPRIKGLFFYESTVIISATKFADFVRDVKKLRDLNPDNMCGVDMYNGFLIRFVKKSTAYLGQWEDSVVVDFNYYRADNAMSPRLNEDVWEEIEQMALFKYGARAHWGKNRNVAFIGARNKYPKFNKFVEAKSVLDPNNVFSSEWSDEIVLGKTGLTNDEDGCGLDGRCICSRHSHCSPANGYFCQPGLVYLEAKVCRYSSSSIN